jgi:hypothetical protein
MKRRGVIFLAFAFCTLLKLSAHAISPTTHQEKVIIRVPFVGCESDGQVGPLKAPLGQSKVVAISAEAAQQLAYYKAENGTGTLAPRGWYCFGTYGSNGSNLYVSSKPINAVDLFSTDWKGFIGPAIQISEEEGGTSGRFGVARTIARVFPAHMAFVRDVIAEGIEPASSFPSGPYSNDKLTYRNKEVVEFQTANTEGLGTESRLQKNGNPISGVAILIGQDVNLIQLSVRLPANIKTLTSAIIQQTEHDAVNIEH